MFALIWPLFGIVAALSVFCEHMAKAHKAIYYKADDRRRAIKAERQLTAKALGEVEKGLEWTLH